MFKKRGFELEKGCHLAFCARLKFTLLGLIGVEIFVR